MCIKYHSIMQTMWSKLVYLWRRRWRPAANVQLHTLTHSPRTAFTHFAVDWCGWTVNSMMRERHPTDRFQCAGPSINIIKFRFHFAFRSRVFACLFLISSIRIFDHWRKLPHHLACTNRKTVAKKKNKTHRNSSIDKNKNGKIMRIHASGCDLYAKSEFAYDASCSIESWIDTSFQFDFG